MNIAKSQPVGTYAITNKHVLIKCGTNVWFACNVDRMGTFEYSDIFVASLLARAEWGSLS